MTTVEDFTQFPLGMEVALEGRVKRCSRCGRNGIEQAGGDGPVWLIHVQSSRVLGDGMLTEPSDYCLVRGESADLPPPRVGLEPSISEDITLPGVSPPPLRT
jgi:hypothetical protein